MRLFLDSANLAEIRAELDLISGVTTNPTLVARESRDLPAHLRRILELIGSRVLMAEPLGEQTGELVDEGRRLAELGPGVMVKVPATRPGLSAMRVLAAGGVKVTATLAFAPMQALLAARAGAAAVAVFVGRLDDAGGDGARVLGQVRVALRQHDLRAETVAASVRSPERAADCALAGAEIVTAPAAVLDRLMEHPLTAAGLRKFAADWARASQEAPARG